jgi:1L-myo-inositol 1-phosphate cytidylyltransferase / CDP-L-myo-inositol myo-inositolphosphotransferase
MQERAGDAMIAVGAAVIMAIGLCILGTLAFQREGIVHFDGAKRIQEQTGSPTARLLRDLTSRDFYCLALLVAALAGVLDVALKVFFAAEIVWLVVIITLLLARAPGPK